MKKYRQFTRDYPFVVLLISALITIIATIAGNHSLELSSFESTMFGLATMGLLILLQICFYVLHQNDEIRSIKEGSEKMSTLLSLTNSMNHLDSDPTIKKGVLSLVDSTDQAVSSISSKAGLMGNRLEEVFRTALAKEVRRCEDSMEQIRTGSLRVVGDEAHELWKSVLSCTEERFFTTNIFTFRETLLGSKASIHLLEEQEEVVKRLGNNCFERLFVYEPSEEGDVAKIVEKQKAIDIHAWMMSRDRFDEISKDGNWIQKIGSDDFTIIDNKFLYLTVVDHSTGRVSYVELYRSGARLTAAIEFSERLASIHNLFLDSSGNDEVSP